MASNMILATYSDDFSRPSHGLALLVPCLFECRSRFPAVNCRAISGRPLCGLIERAVTASRVIPHTRTSGWIEHAQQTQLAFACILDAMHLSFWQINA